MAGVKRSEFTEALKKDSYRWYFESYPEKPPVYQELFEVVPSDAAYEMFTSAVGLGELLEKPEGEDLQADRPMESYTIVCKNRTFGRLVRFSYETVQDVKKVSNLLQTTIGKWASSVVETKEKQHAQIFNYGAYTAGNSVFNNTITEVITDSSGNLIYDGKAFFATDHPDKVGNTYSNYESADSLTPDNLKANHLIFTGTNNRNERGQIIEWAPDTLLIPPALEFTAREILNTTALPYSQDNTLNVLNNIISPVVWPYLTDSDGWFLLKRKFGLMATSRQDVVLDTWEDETSKDLYASILMRMGFCVTNWRGSFACNVSSS